MADVSGSALKRSHPEDNDNNAQKRTRSSTGSSMPTQNGSTTAKIDLDKIMAEAKARAQAVQARLQASLGGAPINAVPTVTGLSAGTPSPAMSKVDQMKARIAEAVGRSKPTAVQRSVVPAPSSQPPAYDDDGLSRGRGGLDVGLHPALLSDTIPDFKGTKRRQGMQTKSAIAGRRTESPVAGAMERAKLDLAPPSLDNIKDNPYFDPSLGHKAIIEKPRQTRKLVFNQKGKYIQQAASLRRQAQLEAMKKRIADRARHAGIDEDLDLEKAFLVPAPPAIEWWDEGLVNGADYAAIDDENNLKIETPDSIVTIYVQHPVLLDPPQEKYVTGKKPMYLTPKEQAKVRRQRRRAVLQEQQAKVRLGLEPAPPPKVKKSNLMRVLGEEAVKDPTAVEARVNREIAERREKHEQANEERKLTKEQRREKLASQQEIDAAKGLIVSVYRIDSLANGRHRFKVSKNAEQNALTGICIMHPRFNLVIVEGGAHSINNYRKLMLNRIDWTENDGPSAVREGNREALAAWLDSEDQKTGELKDLSSNTCMLLWEGQVKARAFRKWLGARICESDAAAKDVLARAKMENFWTLAKSSKPSEFKTEGSV